MASNNAMSRAQNETVHPDLSGESMRGASNAAISYGQSKQDPNLHEDHVVGIASHNATTAAIADRSYTLFSMMSNT